MITSETITADPPGFSSQLNPPPDPAATWGLGGKLLGRAKELARSIGGRVRETLRAAGREAPQLRVLVVDDNRDAADALAEVLGLLGCDTRAYYDGMSALEAAVVFGPDACLLDLVMPGMDGFELAARLRDVAGTRRVLMVATTALGAPEDRVRTTDAGFDYHLVKPIDTPTLFDALRQFGENPDQRS